MQVLTHLKANPNPNPNPNPNQVLTHLKEKLQFVQAENQVLKHDLADLEIELTNKRDVRTRTPARTQGIGTP